ncbi:uncharacterized protein LOC132743652 [Ruditapes philippinarum]|uniref:uncharacterized protein LOC132743652 n=1 Tax=Ruditapes philippinarum TaxID=129788 RepID=UPI00295B7D85|nr:uncharacterized protein LOC132743652 [Ruditapes philippinarum]
MRYAQKPVTYLEGQVTLRGNKLTESVIWVNGMRMGYGYNPSITKDNRCQMTNGDELTEVCRQMMQGFQSSYNIWAAFVTNATCNFINEKRVFLNMTGPNIYKWEEMKPGYGWIDTLRCTAL